MTNVRTIVPLLIFSNIFIAHPSSFRLYWAQDIQRSMRVGNCACALNSPESFVLIHAIFCACLSISLLFPRNNFFLSISTLLRRICLYILSMYFFLSFSLSPKSFFSYILTFVPYYSFQEAIETFSRVHTTSTP